MTQLTERQRDTFEAIVEIAKEGRSPLTSELLERLAYSHMSGLSKSLEYLSKNDLIRVEGGTRGRPRIITLTDRGKAEAKFGIPVLGRISAGPMIAADNNVAEWIDPGTALRTKPGDFFLPVVGDSMIGDLIGNGDLVLIRPNVYVANGAIAAVADTQDEVAGEYLATLKRVYYEPGQETIRLKASNPRYKDLILPAERVFIAGLYSGLFRREIKNKNGH